MAQRVTAEAARPRSSCKKFAEVQTTGITEPNSTTKDLISVRQMIKELQGEAEALTDKLKAAMVAQGAEVLLGAAGKPRGRTSAAAGLTARPSGPTMLSSTGSTANPP